MTRYGIQPGAHSVARPLPAPPRTAAVSRAAQDADRLSALLEEWLVEVKLRYTLGGD
ncbi:MAG TPA: hypothetical protein VM070_01215 [Candidatus Saccharimonadales bacterium]|nr:hypothetical protein [Candidatus Saccharimonadales bacterium]